MSNSMSDDYFSFMSNKWKINTLTTSTQRRDDESIRPSDTLTSLRNSDRSDESFVSDTVIQRIFKRFNAPEKGYHHAEIWIDVRSSMQIVIERHAATELLQRKVVRCSCGRVTTCFHLDEKCSSDAQAIEFNGIL